MLKTDNYPFRIYNIINILMFNEFFFFKIIVLDYALALIVILQVFLNNTIHQKIEKKFLKIFIWIILGLPIFFIFFFKINFFLKNIHLLIFFLFFNTSIIYLYFDKISNILKIKKNTNYFKNKQLKFEYIYAYILFIILQTILFF